MLISRLPFQNSPLSKKHTFSPFVFQSMMSENYDHHIHLGNNGAQTESATVYTCARMCGCTVQR